MWLSQCQVVLGIDVIERMISGEQESEDDRVGVLPNKLQSGLATIFECPFEDRAILTRLGEDTPPAYIPKTSR